MADIFVSTVPFGNIDPLPIRLMERAGLSYQINPLNRKLKSGEIRQFLRDVKVIVAGTEEISPADLAEAKKQGYNSSGQFVGRVNRVNTPS